MVTEVSGGKVGLREAGAVGYFFLSEVRFCFFFFFLDEGHGPRLDCRAGSAVVSQNATKLLFNNGLGRSTKELVRAYSFG